MGKVMDFLKRQREKIDNLIHRRVDTMTVNIGAAYEAVKNGELKESAAELEALSQRINRYSAAKDYFFQLSKDLQNKYIEMSYEEVLAGRGGGGLDFARQLETMKGNLSIVRNIDGILQPVVTNIQSLADPTCNRPNIREFQNRINNLVEKKAVEMAQQNQTNYFSINATTPDRYASCRDEADLLDRMLTEMEDKVTPKMQALYNVRSIYEIVAEGMSNHSSYDTIYKKTENALKMPGDDEMDVTQKLQAFIREYQENGGKSEPSLRFLAGQMESFNNAMEQMTITKLATELGMNPNKSMEYEEELRLEKISDVMQVAGAEAFANFLALFKESGAGLAIEDLAEKESLYFINMGLTEDRDSGEMLFTTKALFDNGLPAGIDLRFKTDEKKQVMLHDIRFHNMPLDRESFLKSTELQRIVSSLPYEMQKQACNSLHVARTSDGSYGRMIVANGSDRTAYEEKQEGVKKDFMEKNFQRSSLVTIFDENGEPSKPELPEEEEDEERDTGLTGWDRE